MRHLGADLNMVGALMGLDGIVDLVLQVVSDALQHQEILDVHRDLNLA